MNSKQKFAAYQQGSLTGNGTVNQATMSSSSSERGYSASLEVIWRTHAKRILRVTQRITNNREDAEDALQDSFLRAYVHLPSFDGRSSIATWLTRIAINSALMILRRRASGSQLSIHDDADSATGAQSLIPVDSSPGPEAQYAELEQQEIVRSAIATLRPSIRRALEIQVLENRSVKETAQKMGLSIAATKSRIFHAKVDLRKSLRSQVGGRSHGTRQLQLSPA
jgi:RNA polymerase sigma factor (sigma-70 family)